MKHKSQRQKGSSYEYDVFFSLKPFMPELLLTKQQGFQLQIDIIDDKEHLAIECKKHRSFSWNELTGYLTKLEQVAPEGYKCVVVFQANRQPALCMARNLYSQIAVTTFQDYFEIAFDRHTGAKKNGGIDGI